MAGGIGRLGDKIDEFTKYLQKCGIDEEFITNIENTLKAATGCLNKILPENIPEFFTAIKNIGESASSVSGLLKAATELIAPAKMAFYGYSGYVIGSAILKLIKEFRKNSELTQLKLITDKQIEQIYLQLAHLRQQALSNLLKNYSHRQKQVNYDKEDNELIQIGMNEARNILKYIPSINQENIKQISQHAEIAIKQILKEIFDTTPNTEKFEYILDSVTSSISSEEIVGFIVYQKGQLSLDKEILNYRTLVSLYGNDVHAIRDAIEIKLRECGLLLYKAICEDWGDIKELCMVIMSNIHTYIIEEIDDLQRQNWINSLTVDYRYAVLDIIKIGNAFLSKDCMAKELCSKYKTSIKLNENTIKRIIFNRAYAGFCNIFMQWINSPQRYVKEIYLGLRDVPQGYWNIIRHPIITAGSLFNAIMHPVATIKNIGIQTWSHPTRAFTGFAANAAVVGIINNWGGGKGPGDMRSASPGGTSNGNSGGWLNKNIVRSSKLVTPASALKKRYNDDDIIEFNTIYLKKDSIWKWLG